MVRMAIETAVSLREAAETLGVSRRQLHRWLADPANVEIADLRKRFPVGGYHRG